MSYLQVSKSTSKKAIIPQLNKVQKVSNNQKLNGSNQELFDKDSDYNCWGFTAFSFKWLPELEWFEEEEMEFCLSKFTKKVKSPRIGDIVVMRGDNILQHTAILTGIKDKTIVHKPGYCKLEVNTIAGARKIYAWTDKVTFRRAVQNKKFSYRVFDKSDFNNGGYYDSDYNPDLA